jgi:hypothetical protein
MNNDKHHSQIPTRRMSEVNASLRDRGGVSTSDSCPPAAEPRSSRPDRSLPKVIVEGNDAIGMFLPTMKTANLGFSLVALL